VKYAEITLDGNVHFIGTQGVGKSTLLRSILFFYNADKTKLGIAREKKRYDEFYFAWQNSYIIYEVVKEDQRYCVLSYKQNGRVAFRFIDSEYKREHYIDEEGVAYESWDRIRNALGKEILFTKSVTSYDEFRKIIYGDNHALKPEFKKYSILETKQYQNIPRTIQNVLLNTKLEAPFIKETIIKSINEEDIKIDLTRYSKTHLRDFETELNDVKIWTKKNRKGEIVIKKQAEAVVENYRSFNYLKNDKLTLSNDLACKINFVKNQLPIVVSELQRERNVLNRFIDDFEQIKEKYNNKMVDFKSTIKELKRQVLEGNKKQKEYSSRNINNVFERTEQKKSLLQQQNNILKEKEILTSQFSELKQKFEVLTSQILNQISTLENQNQSNQNRINQDFSEEKEKINIDFYDLKETLIENNQKNKDLISGKIEVINKDIQDFKIEKESIKHKPLYKKEIDSLNSQISDLEKERISNTNSKLELSSQVQILKKDWEIKEKEIITQFDNDLHKLEQNKANLVDQLKGLDEKMSRLDDSLYGWLNKNYPNWEETIGKVIDEDTVLFNNTLDPNMFDELQKSLYGVKINLDSLPKRIKSQREYLEEKQEIESEIERISDEYQNLFSDKESELSKQKLIFKKKHTQLNENLSKLNYYIDQAEIKLKRLGVDLTEYSQKAETQKSVKLEAIELKISENIEKRIKEGESFQLIVDSLNKQIKLKEQEKNRQIKKLSQEKEEKIDENRKNLELKKSELNEKIEDIKIKEKQEMVSKLSDSKELDRLESELERIATELHFIENHSTLVIEYQKDKRELFDKLPSIKTKLLELEQKFESLVEKEHAETKSQQNKINNQRYLVSDLVKQEKLINKDLEAYNSLIKSEVVEDVIRKIRNNKEQKDLNENAVFIIEKLKSTHFKAIERFRDLEKTTTKFVSNFGEENIFKFQTKFVVDRDYLSFASILKEFIEEDKISHYEKRINERFSRIILQIGREINELTSKEAEIEKIISKINNDFKSKNFVGAIRSVEMRTQKSSNKIVRLLLEIKQFNKEHGISIGQNNMYSAVDNSSKNKKAVELLKLLTKELEQYKKEELTLSESFDLEFRIVENENDSGWVEKLTNVGSEGTDILVKAMLNILLLNVFKENASKKFNDFKLHCMMDEVGKLHPSNVRGILRFANDRNIMLINGSPTSTNAMDYRYTYNLSSLADPSVQGKRFTKVTKLVKAN
jgi:hypothetical protein